MLEWLSDDGHVYLCRTHLKEMLPHVAFKKIGRNKATTFTGFCAKHDSTVFELIDTNDFDANNENQLFLHSYRLVVREYHKQLESIHKVNVAIAEQPKDDPKTMVALAQSQAFFQHNIAPIENLAQHYHDIYRRDLWDILRYKTITINTDSPFVAAGGVFSAGGNLATFIVLPRRNELSIVFASFENLDAFGPIVDIERNGSDFQLYLVSKFILQYTELFVIKPSVFETFTDSQVSKITNFYRLNAFNQKTDSNDPHLTLFQRIDG